MVKNPPANAGDVALILRLGRSPGGGSGNQRQYSHLGNPTGQSSLVGSIGSIESMGSQVSDMT